MAETLRNTLIKAASKRIAGSGQQADMAIAHAWAEAIVDAILTTLADERPDNAMVEAGDDAIDNHGANSEEIWKAMNVAMRDGGETDNG